MRIWKKSLGKVVPKKKKKDTAESEEEDEERMMLHVSELLKEGKKKSPDWDKVLQPQSITYPYRCREISKIPSSSRAEQTTTSYPFLKQRSSVSYYISIVNMHVHPCSFLLCVVGAGNASCPWPQV